MHALLVKHLLLPAHEIFLGRNTLNYARQLEQSQWWSVERLRAVQQRKLRRLLSHASVKCPYYRGVFRRYGVDPHNFALEGLQVLPTLNKAAIRNHADEMIDSSTPGGLMRYSTGGSTGEPLLFFIDRARQAADQAARIRTRRWFGIDVGERELYLWGSPIEIAAQDRMKRWRDRLTNHRLLSAFEMSPRRMSAYLDEIARFDPAHIFGYPSSIARLVRHTLVEGRSIVTRSLKAVFTTGELFIPEDRSIIEEAVSVPVADGYGAREAGFIAHQCPHGRHHVTMESLIVELLDEKGKTVGHGCPGEVTVTHLDAYGMPFIRYRTGDAAIRGEAECPCGRGLETLQIVEGRKTDMLQTPDGGQAHALSVIYELREESGIRQFRVRQRRNLDLEVAVVADGTFDSARQRRIGERLRRRLAGAVVRLKIVDEIPPDPSGKHRYVVRDGAG